MDKGVITVLVCGLGTLLGLLLRTFGVSVAGDVLFYVGAAGLIGSFTNKMAIDALFSPWPCRRLPVPYTGIVERKREQIIEGIARATAEEIITPEALLDWMNDAALLTGLRDAGAEQVRSLCEADGEGRALRERLAEAVRQHVVTLLDSDSTFFAVRSFLAEQGGVGGKLAHATGLGDRDVLVYKILDGIKEKTGEILVSESGTPNREASLFLQGIAQRLKQWNIQSEPVVQRFISLAVERIDVREIVTKSLSQYSAEEIKGLVQAAMREHLIWLEVYGGVFGALGGAGMWLLS